LVQSAPNELREATIGDIRETVAWVFMGGVIILGISPLTLQLTILIAEAGRHLWLRRILYLVLFGGQVVGGTFWLMLPVTAKMGYKLVDFQPSAEECLLFWLSCSAYYWYKRYLDLKDLGEWPGDKN